MSPASHLDETWTGFKIKNKLLSFQLVIHLIEYKLIWLIHTPVLCFLISVWRYRFSGKEVVVKNGACARHDGLLAEMLIVMQLHAWVELLLLPAQFPAPSYFYTPPEPANPCYFFNSAGVLHVVHLWTAYFPWKKLPIETWRVLVLLFWLLCVNLQCYCDAAAPFDNWATGMLQVFSLFCSCLIRKPFELG